MIEEKEKLVEFGNILNTWNNPCFKHACDRTIREKGGVIPPGKEAIDTLCDRYRDNVESCVRKVLHKERNISLEQLACMTRLEVFEEFCKYYEYEFDLGADYKSSIPYCDKEEYSKLKNIVKIMKIKESEEDE